MQISRIDLNLLVILEAIHAEGGVTKAADRLHLSQPAISHSLSKLREMFNDQLFERQGNRMVPTPVAMRLIEPLRGSLASIGRLLNDVEVFNPATTGRKFNIGTSGTGESSVMPTLMAAMTSTAPGASVAFLRTPRARLEADLAGGSLDVAIDVPMPYSDAIRRSRIYSDHYVVIARKKHPQVRGRLDVATYLAQSHIMITGRRQGLGEEDMALRKLNLVRRVALRCQSYFAACATVAKSDLLLTLTRRHALMAAGSYDFQMLELEGVFPSADACLYWHSSAERDPANAWLRSLIELVPK